jgi:hypothetical protein
VQVAGMVAPVEAAERVGGQLWLEMGMGASIVGVVDGSEIVGEVPHRRRRGKGLCPDKGQAMRGSGELAKRGEQPWDRFL